MSRLLLLFIAFILFAVKIMSSNKCIWIAENESKTHFEGNGKNTFIFYFILCKNQKKWKMWNDWHLSQKPHKTFVTLDGFAFYGLAVVNSYQLLITNLFLMEQCEIREIYIWNDKQTKTKKKKKREVEFRWKRWEIYNLFQCYTTISTD